jgi:hypothetical protein
MWIGSVWRGIYRFFAAWHRQTQAHPYFAAFSAFVVLPCCPFPTPHPQVPHPSPPQLKIHPSPLSAPACPAPPKTGFARGGPGEGAVYDLQLLIRESYRTVLTGFGSVTPQS